LDYEARAIYPIKIRSTDRSGLFVEVAIEVRVLDMNEAPLGVTLTSREIAEGSAANASVGQLGPAGDPDAVDSYTYSLVTNPDELFEVLGDTLVARTPFDFEVDPTSYRVTVRVRDQGPGIPSGDRARVFEPFARGSAAGQGGTGGTGLGLTIAKMLTELMGGEMTVDSQPGRGSVFRVRLFLPELHSDALPAPKAAARVGYAGERRRILVVDNEEADRGLLVSVLEPLGFDLRTAASGEQCLAMLREGRAQPDGWRPDAIFMDLAMPGIDGWETLRRIRLEAIGPAALAIVSANAFDKGLDNDVGITPRDFITKPVRVGELLDWLGRALALSWITADLAVAAVTLPAVATESLALPAEPHLRALQELVNIGYVRGIVKRLDQIETESPACAAFVERMRAMARGFQLDEMNGVLTRALES
jgi:CheY-like chemotaxis protein